MGLEEDIDCADDVSLPLSIKTFAKKSFAIDVEQGWIVLHGFMELPSSDDGKTNIEDYLPFINGMLQLFHANG